MSTLWRQFLVLGFRLLYHELAWSYDVVSWLASRGLWRRWQRAALPYLPAQGRFLEVGFGPGHLLLDLARGPDGLDLGGQDKDCGQVRAGCQAEAGTQRPTAGRRVIGLDLSSAMLRLAQRRLSRHALAVPLVQGRAQELPFASDSFDAVVLTFPTPFVYERAWIQDLVRVLRAADQGADAPPFGGRVVVVEQAEFEDRGALDRFMGWLYGVTGQRGPAPDLRRCLEEGGLQTWREEVPVNGTTVRLIVAERAAPS